MAKETVTQRKRRLKKALMKRMEKATSVAAGKRKRRRKANARVMETEDERVCRQQKDNQRHAAARAIMTEEERVFRQQKNNQRHTAARAIETEEERVFRQQKDNQKHTAARAIETEEERVFRQQKDNQRHTAARAIETEEETVSRQQADRKRHASAYSQQREIISQRRQNSYAQRSAEMNNYFNEINTFCDRTCDVCLKQCYPNQVTRYHMLCPKPYLPPELASKLVLEVCHRCKSHLTDVRKNMAPPKAYWNNLDPGEIPDVIKILHESEYRLLRRINPHLKVIKFGGRFGQYGFKGQAILFALDIFEVSDKLPYMLPRSSEDAGIVVITETLENLNISRDFPISRDRVYSALRWLIANNPLYHDVTINHFARLDPQDMIRVIPADSPQQQPEINETGPQRSAYMRISECSRIIRGTWHQGCEEIFKSGFAGVQCFAMVAANIIRASILPPGQWTPLIIDGNMFAGDDLYAQIRFLTEASEGSAFRIPPSGFLSLRNLDVLQHDVLMYEKSVALQYDDDWLCSGSLMDRINDGVIQFTLRDAIARLFEEHDGGILIVDSKSLGVMHYNDKFYFTDSHACGAKGTSASSNGKACVIECDNMEEFLRIIRRTVHSRNTEFMISYIDVRLIGENLTVDQYLQQQNMHKVDDSLTLATTEPQEYIENPLLNDSNYVPVQTSIMAPIDCMQPDVEDEFHAGENINEIRRKTKDNIVNFNHEKKAEEFSWYNLFPYGVNGLNEVRKVPITALDYFQSRILGRDTRFQRTDYLFWSLSMSEYERTKSTISACCKKVQGTEGNVEDLHLYMKNLRGSAAYWKTAHNELIAMIRSIGAPTWFVTLSCNDLNWTDMRKALLLADNQPDTDPKTLTANDAQHLIERYPIVLSRHYMRRFNAFMKYMQANDRVLGGRIKDFWWRIEFQNRGSPHVHMVVWIENAPPFETEEGIGLIDATISCRLPSEEEDSVLHEMVKRHQIHRHTHSCYKNNSSECRFCFPRSHCHQTRILSHTSDEFIKNGGRTCLLKRRGEDKHVNNYNREILELWEGNIDIQPCGNDERIAYYIGKYISKNEPTNLNEGIARTIQQIRREETNISRRMFKICMRILNERQVSACECAYRLCRLNLRGSSRNCVFVNTRRREQRYRVLKFDGDEVTGFASNIFDRYENRPKQHPDYNFKEMSLVEFAMLFEPYYKKTINNEESVDAENEQQQGRRRLITLTDNSKMAIRNVPAVVRVPYFQMHTDPENYFYSLLLQYQPYENENELIEEYASARDAFLAREQQLKEKNKYMEAFRTRDQHLENAFAQVHAFNLLERHDEFLEPELEEEGIPDQAMTDEQFQLACSALNIAQRDLVNALVISIQQQLSGDIQRLRLFVTGGAGVGKTFVLHVLKNQVNRCYNKQAVKVAAPTGVAARLVGGFTLHSMLKLPVQKNGIVVSNMQILTGNYLKAMRQQWKDVEFLFIDEISMVPYELLCMIDSRLRQLKKKPDEVFGGLNIIVFGDLMQLPPVRASPIFRQPVRLQPATHLWRLFRLCELKENMRQREDTTFSDLLNALRIGKLEKHQFELLLSKILKETTGEFALNMAIRIYPTRAQVDAHNNLVLEHYRSQGLSIYKIVAQDRITDANRNTDNVDLNKIVPVDVNKTGGLPKQLEIFVGAKVMLRSNINVERGLVNGAIGNITEIIWPHFRRDQMYETDIPTVCIDFGRDGIHRIEPRCVEFPANLTLYVPTGLISPT